MSIFILYLNFSQKSEKVSQEKKDLKIRSFERLTPKFFPNFFLLPFSRFEHAYDTNRLSNLLFDYFYVSIFIAYDS